MAFSKSAIRRLMKDHEELIHSPVQNISAAPLDSNMFEWHCNIQQDKDTMYHVILFFPKDYPYSSPSAEFVPMGLQYAFTGGAIKSGKKGDQICLNIFSDFGSYHREWASERGGGWSPGYTAQTILLNVISFLAEHKTRDSTTYQKLCEKFTCRDCGHTFEKPYPPLNVEDTTSQKDEEASADEAPQKDVTSSISTQIVDYISKENFDSSENELFGYGLVLTQTGTKSTLTTPCEFLTSDTFHNMKRVKGVIHSIMKEELKYFMPLYINDPHGSRIRNEFEKMLRDVTPVLFPQEVEEKEKPNIFHRLLERMNFKESEITEIHYADTDIILKLIPNLMCSTVVKFSQGSTHTSDNSLQGYFALHRLFMWAMETYPELETEIEKRLEAFVTNPQNRTKDSCPDIGQWLMLLSVSKRFTWQCVASSYLSESYKRNVMWYIKSEPSLRNLKLSQNKRIKHTFRLTKVSRNLLSFQVAFLKIAKPDTLSQEQIIARYEANLGFPTTEMVTEMKEACQKIKSRIRNYKEWYSFLGLEYPKEAGVHETLKESVIYAKNTNGYHFSR